MGFLSDFEWKSLVSGGIKAGVTGVVAGSVTYALAWTLDSVFGLEVGKPGRVDQKNQMIEQLQEINSEITDINDSLQQIETSLANLNATMSTDFEKTLAAIATANVLQAVSEIESAWQSLASLVANTITNGSTPDGSTDDFITQALQVNDIQTQLNLITNSMLPMGASSPGLIDTWTTTLILQMQQGAKLRDSYLWLEQSFLQYIHYLFLGHSLMVAIKIQQGWVEGNTLSENEAAAQNIGNNYMSKFAGPNLAAVSQMFLQSVHRLILSQYMVPNASKTDFLPFASQEDVDFILGRANLACWLINRGSEDAANPGILLTSYLRPSQVGSAAPSLSPGSSWPSSSGTLFTLEYGYDTQWYKVIDSVNGDVTQLRDIKDSNILIANYAWSTPTPAVGKAVSSSAPFSRVVPQYYDKTSLSPVSTASDNTVVYGYTTDMSAIVANLLWSSPWKLNGSSNTTVHKNDDSSKITMLQYTVGVSPSGGTISLNSHLMVTGDYKDDAQTFSNSLSFPLTYKGSSSSSIFVLCNAQMNSKVSPGGAPAGYSPVPMQVSSWGEVPNSQNVTGTYSLSTPEDNDPPVTSSYTMNYFQTITVSANENVSPTFDVSSTAQQQDWYKNYNNGYNNDNASNGTITWQVSRVQVAWPQPQVS
ncbi:hypothetical protein [Hyalangium versicolor]|uniref:hypothetical protein n=1 Tax=Hyalangium versicolor TaxID=2861190 RepID=UPI001CCD1DD0|nr:hypothetical protein [Hyalangium versicolor]